jgi:putative nucleotidyltransferase with HDIG domain
VDELTFIDTIATLPSPSPVLRRIAAVTANPESPVSQVVDALKLDPAIAGKILRLANSAYIGMPRSVSSLHNAVVLLGTKRIQSIIMVAQFADPFNGKKNAHSFPLERYWRHSTTLALIAESIGRHLKRYEIVDEQELFSAAILHDIGKLVLAVHEPSVLVEADQRARREQVPFYCAENDSFSHTAIGALLSEKWGFPFELSAAIASHHAPDRAGAHARFVSIIHVADVTAHLIGYSTFEDEIAPLLDEKALAAIQLPPERLRVIAETEVENQSKIEELCGIFGMK